MVRSWDGWMYTPLKLTANAPEIGGSETILSFSEGLCSGAMLVFGRAILNDRHICQLYRFHSFSIVPQVLKQCPSSCVPAMMSRNQLL